MPLQNVSIFRLLLFFVALLGISEMPRVLAQTEPYITILGTTQDAGAPHIACTKQCCMDRFRSPQQELSVVCLGLIDPVAKQKYIFEATPDLPRQMRTLYDLTQRKGNEAPDAIFLTHAHIGHYSGLMFLGKEGLGAREIPCYAMPRMFEFLSSNGPWDGLVENNNIDLRPLSNNTPLTLNPKIVVTPFLVPHRDEYSETVGYKIVGPNKSIIFIPDIDKWEKWETNIVDEIKNVDYAFLDATFYDGDEISNRDMSEIPHPFVVESLELFKDLPPSQKQKVYFIHLNHTNPILNPESRESVDVKSKGFNIARKGMVFRL